MLENKALIVVKEKTKLKINRKIIIGIVLICIIVPIVFSYFNPGKLYIVDTVRLYFQIKIMDVIGRTRIGEYNRDENGNKIAGKDRITYDELNKYFDVLETGDILCTESTNYLSAKFIPGRWKHTIIYIGNKADFEKIISKENSSYNIVCKKYKTGKEILILDSSVYGVSVRNFSDLYDLTTVSCLKSLIAYRLELENSKKEIFLTEALKYLGKPYDYDMLTDDINGIYCVELAYMALKKININIDERISIAGKEVIIPTGLVTYLDKSKLFKRIMLLEKENYIVSNNV